MFVAQTDILNVPAASGTIMQNNEVSGYERSFIFRNLTANVMSFKIQESDDGAAWVNVDTIFDLGPRDLGSDLVIRHVTSKKLLRVVGAGGGDDRDLLFTLTRVYVDALHVWSSPLT